MGRTAGATAAGTRDRLLRAAADVCAGRGYDGARVPDSADASGASNGARHAYSPSSQAQRPIGTVRAHGRRQIADLVGAPAPAHSGEQRGTDP